MLRDALAVALELSHNYIGTEHLLLGLYRNADSPAAAILTAAGGDRAERAGRRSSSRARCRSRLARERADGSWAAPG